MTIVSRPRRVALSAVLLCAASALHAEAPASTQVLFVCEHGSAKSLMAASYFDQLARERGLPFRAVSRGSAPNSDAVPARIVRALADDGIDIGDYRPTRVSAADVTAAERVILLGATLPDDAMSAEVAIERWDDVPSTTSYERARAGISKRVQKLLDELTRTMNR